MRSEPHGEATSGTGGPTGGTNSTIGGTSDIPGDATPYATSAHKYLEAGWNPLPLLDQGKGKVPAGFTGYAARKVTGADISRWVDEQNLGSKGVCLRLMYEVGIDIDGYDASKDAAGVWASLVAEHGEPPPTVRVSSRFGAEDYDGLSGIKVFRLPNEYRQDVEARIWKGQLGSGIDVIRLGHRQVVAWPTLHPKLGTRYQYLDERTGEIVNGPLPPVDTLPELPAAWVEVMFTSAPKVNASNGKRPGRTTSGGGSQWWTEGVPCQAVNTALGQILRSLRSGHHDNALRGLTKLTRLGEQGHSGVQRAVDRLCGEFVLAVDADRDEPALDEWGRMVDKLDALIDSGGLTPEHKRGCCPTDSNDIPPSPGEATFDGTGPDLVKRLRVIEAADATITRVKYLWADRIPIGANTLLPGEEGIGKTTVCTRIVADLTNGTLPGEFFGTPRHALVVAPEDGINDVAIPRLKQAGADLSKVTFVASRLLVADNAVNETGIVVPRDLPLLAAKAREKNTALVWFDSFVSVMPDEMKSISYKDVNKVMAACKRFAEDNHLAVIAPWHLNKASGSDTAIRMMDSRGFRTAVRSLLLIVGDPERPGEGLIALDKSNAADTSSVPAMRYRLDSSTYTVDEVDPDTGDVVEREASCGVAMFVGEEVGFGRDNARDMLAPHMDREDDPKSWLRDYLTTAGESLSVDVYRHGKDVGHSRSAIHRAGQRLGVVYRDDSLPGKPPTRRTWWRLPDHPTPSSHFPYPQTTGTNGTMGPPPTAAHPPGESQKEMNDLLVDEESPSSPSSRLSMGRAGGTHGGSGDKPVPAADVIDAEIVSDLGKQADRIAHGRRIRARVVRVCSNPACRALLIADVEYDVGLCINCARDARRKVDAEQWAEDSA